MSLDPDDLPSQAQCACVLVARGVAITSACPCPLHHPFLGLLVEQPVKFMGIPLFAAREPAPE